MRFFFVSSDLLFYTVKELCFRFGFLNMNMSMTKTLDNVFLLDNISADVTCIGGHYSGFVVGAVQTGSVVEGGSG